MFYTNRETFESLVKSYGVVMVKNDYPAGFNAQKVHSDYLITDTIRLEFLKPLLSLTYTSLKNTSTITIVKNDFNSLLNESITLNCLDSTSEMTLLEYLNFTDNTTRAKILYITRTLKRFHFTDDIKFPIMGQIP